MAIGVAVTPAVLASRAIEPLRDIREGEIVEARVLAVLSKGLVRLTLHGVTLDVDTPIELLAGLKLRVTVETRDGALRLILKEVSAPLAQAQAPATAGPTPSPAPGAQSPPKLVTTQPATDLSALSGGEHPAPAIELAKVVQQYAANEPLGELPAALAAFVAAGQGAQAANLVPLTGAAAIAAAYLTNGTLPLHLDTETVSGAIESDDDLETTGHGTPAPTDVVARVTFDGLLPDRVDAELRLDGPVLGVTLWCARPSGVKWLQGHEPAIRASLHMDGHVLHELAIISALPDWAPQAPGQIDFSGPLATTPGVSECHARLRRITSRLREALRRPADAR